MKPATCTSTEGLPAVQPPFAKLGAGKAAALVAAVRAAPEATIKGIEDFNMILSSGSL